MKSHLFIFIILLSTTLHANANDTPDLMTRYTHDHIDYQLNADGSHVETHDWAMKILKENAIANAKSTSITYSTSIQKTDVISAYTIKADGRRIDAPKSNYQLETNSGKDQNAPVFSDLATLTVVFPDVATGDTVGLVYKITQTEAMFPGQFSEMAYFPKNIAYDDIRIRLDYPTSLNLNYETRQMQTEENSEAAGRKTLVWTYQNKSPILNKRRDYSVYDVEQDPGYSISTFKTYAEIAHAYGIRALPKAAVTERIQQLANELTKNQKTPSDQARALYEWVATHISYAGNCIGVGAVVPHDTNFILDNRMGDCKDHATLLQALLAAKGIASTQALINAGSTYNLPKIPVVSMVNHVINYLPDLHLYLDSTSDSTPYGMLPFNINDKPTLLTTGYQEGTRTPATSVGSNSQIMKSQLIIHADGSVSDNISVSATGLFAVSNRERFRRLNKDQQTDLVKNIYKNSGYSANGTINLYDTETLANHYHYQVQMNLEQFVQRPGSGAFNIYPLFVSAAPIQDFLRSAIAYEDNIPTACVSGYSEETYNYQFPKDMKILAIPNNINITNNALSYHASYRLQGNTLIIKRSLDDQTPGNVCTPEKSNSQKKLAIQAWQNMKAQVLYK